VDTEHFNSLFLSNNWNFVLIFFWITLLWCQYLVYVASSGRVTDELRRIWKEVVMVQLR
jgi:hypothetical protein